MPVLFKLNSAGATGAILIAEESVTVEAPLCDAIVTVAGPAAALAGTRKFTCCGVT